MSCLARIATLVLCVAAAPACESGSDRERGAHRMEIDAAKPEIDGKGIASLDPLTSPPSTAQESDIPTTLEHVEETRDATWRALVAALRRRGGS